MKITMDDLKKYYNFLNSDFLKEFAGTKIKDDFTGLWIDSLDLESTENVYFDGTYNYYEEYHDFSFHITIDEMKELLKQYNNQL